MIPDIVSGSFEVPAASLPKLLKRTPVRTKHWFRVITRYSSNGGQTWTKWRRWCPNVDAASPSFHGTFKTLAAAKAEVAKEQARHAREQKRGTALIDLGGGLAASMKVEKGSRHQYAVIEEVTTNLLEEVIE